MRNRVKKLLEDRDIQELLKDRKFKEVISKCFDDGHYSDTVELLNILKGINIYINDSKLPKGFLFLRDIIGKKVKLVAVDSELWEDDPEDEEAYRALVGSTGTILNATIYEYDPTLSDEENFTNTYWSVDFGVDGILDGMHGSYFKLLN